MRQIDNGDELRWQHATIGTTTGADDEARSRSGLPANTPEPGTAANRTSTQPPLITTTLPFGYGNADGWTAREQTAVEDALRHVTAQFQPASSPPSSPTAVGAPSPQPPATPPPQASVDPETPTPLGQVVMQKPVELSQTTTPNPAVAVPSPTASSSPSG